MSRPLRLAGAVLALVPVFVLAFATTAAADSGCGAIGKPPCTILRPIPAPSHRWVPADAPACVVAVGGLGSWRSDDFFDPLLDPLQATDDGRPLLKLRFGDDRSDLYPYDTYGAIDRQATRLRSLIRDLSDECFTIDVVAHSMGGVVADRAFSKGMSAADGVTTYLPLSSPHNGSFVLRALRLGVELDETWAEAASTIAQRLRVHDPTKAAMPDLAMRKHPRPPRGVETVRQRLVNDEAVLRGDHVDRRFDVREYLPGAVAELEGHGGIAQNRQVQDVVARTIRSHAIPPDDRSLAEQKVASFASRLIERYEGGLVASGGLALAGIAVGSAIGSAVGDAAHAVAAGDAAGGAAILGADVGALAGRVTDHAADEVELIEAAKELRDPPKLALLKTLLQTVSE